MIRKDVTQKYISGEDVGEWQCNYCKRHNGFASVSSMIRNKKWTVLSKDIDHNERNVWVCPSCRVEMGPLFKE